MFVSSVPLFYYNVIVFLWQILRYGTEARYVHQPLKVHEPSQGRYVCIIYCHNLQWARGLLKTHHEIHHCGDNLHF